MSFDTHPPFAPGAPAHHEHVQHLRGWHFLQGRLRGRLRHHLLHGHPGHGPDDWAGHGPEGEPFGDPRAEHDPAHFSPRRPFGPPPPPPPGGPFWPGHGPFRPGGPGGRGPRRARRGDIKAALLAVLADKPLHGYELMRELEQRTNGRWRPSPGSIYPTLQLLEDEGLVRSEERDGKRIYAVTDAGRAEVEAHRERTGGAAPWAFAGAEEDDAPHLGETLHHLMEAAQQVQRTGTPEQIERAEAILVEARKRLYGLLSEE